MFNDNCPICQEQLPETHHTLECNHGYCTTCIVRHFRVSGDCRCPVCRDTAGIVVQNQHYQNQFLDDEIIHFPIDEERMNQLKNIIRKDFNKNKKIKKKKLKLLTRKKTLTTSLLEAKESYRKLKKSTAWKKYKSEYQNYWQKRSRLSNSMDKFKTDYIDNIDQLYDLNSDEMYEIKRYITHVLRIRTY